MATETTPCSLESLSTRLEELEGAQCSAAEERVKNMRNYRLKDEKLHLEISAHVRVNVENEVEKAQHLKEAQRLLAAVMQQLLNLQAQETKENELIKKHNEEREKLEVLLQERLRPQGKQSCETMFKDLEERLDLLILKTMMMPEGQFCDKYEKIFDAIITLEAAYLCSAFSEAYRTSEIGMKKLGELIIGGSSWYNVCWHKFKSGEIFMEWTSMVDHMLRIQIFHPPMKGMQKGNNNTTEVAIDEDKWLCELRNNFDLDKLKLEGFGIGDLEIKFWNLSGRWKLTMPWDSPRDSVRYMFRWNKRLNISRMFERLQKELELEEVQNNSKQLKVRNAAAPPRKRGRAT